MSDDSLIEKLISSSKIYEGKIFNLRNDQVKLPNGRLTDRQVVEHPGAVAIIPIKGEKILLVRQFRQAAGKLLSELPAGTLIRGEDPEKCASRELEEETGYRAENLKKLFHCFVAPGYSTEIIHFYLATDLRKTRKKLDADEFIKVITVTNEQALQMIQSNEIEDAKTICGLLVIQNLLKD